MRTRRWLALLPVLVLVTVRATVNGQPHPLPGKTGEVLRDHVIRAPAAAP